jgi:diguanylate cyclase (GGDEF)-like protein
MEPLVAVFLSLRRWARRALPLAIALLPSLVVAVHATHRLDDGVFSMFIVALLAAIVVRAVQRSARVDHSTWRDMELGGLLLVASYAVAVHVDGDLEGRFYPLVYVAIGVMSAFARPLASLAMIALLMVFELGLRELAYGGVEPLHYLPHLGFALVFGLLNTLSLRMELERLRRASRTELQAERERIRDEARSYRLLRAPAEGADADRAGDEERLLCSGVEQIELTVLFALRLLKTSLGLHTALVLWLDESGRELRIGELVSEDLDVCEGPFSVRDGILGAVLSEGKPVSLGQLKPGFLLPYYRDTCPAQSVCAVPLDERGSLRGMLLVDRLEAQSFSADELELTVQAGRFVMRAIENERVFVQLERTKVEQGKLYRAAEHLGAAISEQEVVDVGVRAASDIATVDFAAFTSYEASSASHQIRAASGSTGARDLVGRSFADNAGLVSMALRNRHPLPYRGDYDADHQMVFARDMAPPPLPSLLVLPLVVQQEPLGALVLASREPGAFHDAARHLLEVLASHLAVSLSNARMVRRLEEQARTDGLTGLLNKRALLESAGDKLRAARRFGRRLSLVVADIDHFKSVNDTYGHDVGDVVIKGLANIHAQAKRTTDAVARFGGEEFVTICEETDAEGAFLLAERIRAEFARTAFQAGGKSIHCTCSLGIATFPETGHNWDELFKAADAALYTSKRSGRNRTTIFDPGRDHAAA